MTALKTLVASGPQHYVHAYMRTTTSHEEARHVLECPQTLVTLARGEPQADVVEYGDGTLGIELDSRLWAAESPDRQSRPAIRLQHEVWHYLHMALGHDGTTVG